MRKVNLSLSNKHVNARLDFGETETETVRDRQRVRDSVGGIKKSEGSPPPDSDSSDRV